jgi:hypothetical protein
MNNFQQMKLTSPPHLTSFQGPGIDGVDLSGRLADKTTCLREQAVLHTSVFSQYCRLHCKPEKEQPIPGSQVRLMRKITLFYPWRGYPGSSSAWPNIFTSSCAYCDDGFYDSSLSPVTIIDAAVPALGASH